MSRLYPPKVDMKGNVGTTDAKQNFSPHQSNAQSDETRERSISATSVDAILNALALSQKLKLKLRTLQEVKTKDHGSYKVVSVDVPTPKNAIKKKRPVSQISSQRCAFGIDKVKEANEEARNNKENEEGNYIGGFKVLAANNLMRSVLEDALSHESYNPERCGQQAKLLSEQIKSRMKQLLPSRFKLISTVFIGEMGKQDLRVASRCTWDEHVDNYAECTYQNNSLWAVAVAYGVYSE